MILLIRIILKVLLTIPCLIVDIIKLIVCFVLWDWEYMDCDEPYVLHLWCKDY